MDEKGREPPPVAPAAEAPKLPTPAGTPKRRAGGVKRKALSGLSNSTSSKRHSKQRKTPFAHLHPIHSGPVTRARQSPNKLAAAAAAAVNLVQVPTGGAEAAGITEGSGLQGSGDGLGKEGGELSRKEEPLVDLEFEAVRSRGTNIHVVPTHAGWFSWNKVHPVEEQTMASFFNGKYENKTPDIYVEIRNSIMKTFHANPQTLVEPDNLSDISAGDMDARKEVLEFLDHWGLINFHPFPPNDSDASVPEADEEESKTFALIQKLYQFEPVQASCQADSKGLSLAPAQPPRLVPETSLAEDLAEEPSVEYHCNSCSGDCSRKRYHCQKQADFDLCSECYNAKKFGQGMAASDFILMESAEIHRMRGGSWTDQETLLLLEALELFGENWNEIAEHVATKTKAQCFLHFIQMPIEDSFLEGHDSSDIHNLVNSALQSESSGKDPTGLEVPETPNDKNNENGDEPTSSAKEISEEKDGKTTKLDQEIDDTAIDALRVAFNAVGFLPEQENLPSFTEAGNPVMTLAVFLSRLIDNGIANMYTQSSLKAIFDESPALQLATRHCFPLEDPLDDNKNQRNDINNEATSNRESDEKEKEIEIPNGSKELGEVKDTKDENAVKEESDLPISSEDCPQKLNADEEDKPNETTLPKNDTGNDANTKESAESSMPEDQVSGTDTKGSVDLESKDNEAAEPTEVLKNSSLEAVEDVTLTTRSEPNNLLLEEGKQNSAMDIDVVKDDDAIAITPSDSCAALEPQPADSTGLAEMKELAVSEDVKMHSSEASKSSLEDNTDRASNLKKIKRAALTALSAVAVKAKVLGMHEEEYIRHYASTVITKQLQKLELKMALYNDIEAILMRVKEQLDKARKKLYQERTQIIAARFGFPSSSRLPHSLMPVRFGVSQGMIGTKLANMVPQNPPATKP